MIGQLLALHLEARAAQHLLEGQDRLPAPAGVAVRVVGQAQRAPAPLVEGLHVRGLHGAQARTAGVGHERGQGRRGRLRQRLLDGVQLGLEVVPRVVQEHRDRHAHGARVPRVHLLARSGRGNARDADEGAHRTTSRGSMTRPSGEEPPIGRFDVAGAMPWNASTS